MVKWDIGGYVETPYEMGAAAGYTYAPLTRPRRAGQFKFVMRSFSVGIENGWYPGTNI